MANITKIPLDELLTDKLACIDDLRLCLDALDKGTETLVQINNELTRRRGEDTRSTPTAAEAQIAISSMRTKLPAKQTKEETDGEANRTEDLQG